MKANELISALEELINKHGDIEVWARSDSGDDYYFTLGGAVPNVSPDGSASSQVIDFGSANGDRTRTLRLERE